MYLSDSYLIPDLGYQYMDNLYNNTTHILVWQCMLGKWLVTHCIHIYVICCLVDMMTMWHHIVIICFKILLAISPYLMFYA